MAMDTRLEIRLPAAMRTELGAQAAARGWPTAMLVREAIRLMLRGELGNGFSATGRSGTD